ncbi:DNA-binding transcriptional regulator Fis [Vreelandella massiliensis]|uniref:DNA-binding transcriptional regulator Fis n=1 Tax=Vreelandella massiliensis TaxID=1816686 RepID=UPI00096A9B98|nr:DNA-binding transcriptional regulator Fis [Halomonas massiliensis]MYL24390.1 DNA-binding transcriptional regulator Fis [Halomonas alkaliantarctica]
MNERDLLSQYPASDAMTSSAEPATDTTGSPQPLREAVEVSMQRYFEHLDGGDTSDLYAMVLAEVEAPLLASVMAYAEGNQTRAATLLGLNRGTLRKKLKCYGLLDSGLFEGDAP